MCILRVQQTVGTGIDVAKLCAKIATNFKFIQDSKLQNLYLQKIYRHTRTVKMRMFTVFRKKYGVQSTVLCNAKYINVPLLFKAERKNNLIEGKLNIEINS